MYERLIMGVTFFILVAVELTIAKTKPEALFFAMCVLGVGLAFRAYSHKVSGLKTLTVTRKVADMVSPDLVCNHAIAAWRKAKKSWSRRAESRGVLAFALDEAQLRKATLASST